MIHFRRALPCRRWIRKRFAYNSVKFSFVVIVVLFTVISISFIFIPGQKGAPGLLSGLPLTHHPIDGSGLTAQQFVLNDTVFKVNRADWSAKPLVEPKPAGPRSPFYATLFELGKIAPPSIFLANLAARTPARAKTRFDDRRSAKILSAEAKTVQDIQSNQDKIDTSIVWDTSLDHTDRIVEQLHYVPLRWNASRLIYILVYEKGGQEQLWKGRKKFLSDGCRMNNCHILMWDNSIEDLNHITNNLSIHIDAVISSRVIPKEVWNDRRSDDVWIYYDLESPVNGFVPTNLDNTFNWTATYRHDSTLVAPYEKWVQWSIVSKRLFKPYSGAESYAAVPLPNYAYGKTKMAAIVISNCQSYVRMKYIKELKARIPVDVYGACGKTCGENDVCFKMIQQHYKFYLAFENANCWDYITEKFFRNALSYNTIPVVFGARSSDYKRAAPPMSYIHVEDFPTIRHLANYMKVVAEDDDLYNTFFRWKGTGSFINTKFWCRLCAMLNDLDKPRLMANDLGRWWENGVCRDWEADDGYHLTLNK